MEEAEYCHRLALMNRGRLVALGTPAELRAGMALPIFEVWTDDAVAGLEAVTGARGVRDAALFGRALHVVAEPEDRDGEAARRALAAAGHPIHRLGAGAALARGRVRLARARHRWSARGMSVPRVIDPVRLRAIARKEWLQLRREPRSMALAFALPLFLLVFFGYTITWDIDDVPLSVLDRDRSRASRELV